MTGALWAVFSGVGFGVFQTFNRRAVQGMDVFMATFLQLLVSAVVLLLATVLTLDATIIGRLTATAVLNFSLAGMLHFFVGWTFLNASQKQIGAARTSSLIGTIPIFGAFFAAVTLAELPTLYGVIGILLIVGGVYLVNDAKIHRVPVAATVGNPRPVEGAARQSLVPGNPTPEEGAVRQPPVLEGRAIGLRSLGFGLAAAICWSLSPTFIRYGLAEVDFPLLGVTVGIVASVLGYAVVLLVRRSQGAVGPMEMEALAYKVFAAILVALATWMRWISLDLAPVAVALALSLVSVPVVNFLSPLVSGRDLERVTTQVWSGSGLIIGGSLLLILLS